MKSYKVWSLTLLSILICLTTTAHSKTPAPKTATVTIIVPDNEYREGLEVEFIINQNGINTTHTGYTKSYNYKLNQRINKFIVPLSTDLNYGRISFFKLTEAFDYYDTPMSATNDLFIFEDKDDVSITLGVHRNQATFTGKSASKFKCLYEMNSMENDLITKVYNYYLALNNQEKAFYAVKDQCDSMLKVKMQKLQVVTMNPKVMEVVKLDLWAESQQNAIAFAQAALHRQEKSKIAAPRSFILSNFGDTFVLPAVDENMLAFSHKVGDFLELREKSFAVAATSSDSISSFPKRKFKMKWEAIMRHYKQGEIKNKVLLTAFIDFDRGREADCFDYIDSAIQQAASSKFEKLLLDFKLSHIEGAQAFPFALKNSEGKMVTLKDLNGRVVVIDFWFTGCSGCLQMTKVLNPIIAEYKGNSNIVFVSISIDRVKSLWLRSLKEEKYSSKDEINLITENEPRPKIIQYYNVNAFPSLIVISKKGTLISSAPPDPRINLAAFKELLNNNL